MSHPEIIERLSKKLESVPKSEEDIIFILSKVRKILELNHHPDKYSVLNFYCNLALHSKIDKPIPKILSDELIRVHENLEAYHPFIGYSDLHNQLIEFISEYNLPNFYNLPDYNRSNLTNLLNAIYHNTPVIVKVIKEYEVRVDKNGTVSGKYIES